MTTLAWRDQSRTAPALNAVALRARGWLEERRVRHASSTQDVVLRPLHRPALKGYLAAEVGGYLVELRIPDNWDAVGRPCVMVQALHGGGQAELFAGDRVSCGGTHEVAVLAIDTAAMTATVRLIARDLRVTRRLAGAHT